MECNPNIAHSSLRTAYKKGCRGTLCMAANAAASKAWREAGGTCSDEAKDEFTMSLSEWAKERGYDVKGRVYS